MLSEKFSILFILIINFKLYFSSFEDEYPGIVICQNDNLQQMNTQISNSTLFVINELIKKRCTHIQGSLYIRNIVNLELDRTELNFDSLKEIDGHLVIERNHFTKISFKNLRIIRGLSFRTRKIINTSYTNFALDVTGNSKLIQLDLSSLRAINDHNVLFDNNGQLRYLPHKIDWDELFTLRKKQKLISSSFTSDILNRDKCSQVCKKWANTTQSQCWGPSDNQCQQKVKCPNNLADCETCKFDGNGEVQCCNYQCVGGCNGPTPTNCIACKSVLNENKCVDSCPGPYIGGIAGTTRNKEFKYHTGSFCSKACPEKMIPEESYCVYKCSEGYFKNESNHCVKCYGDKCKKEDLPCEMMKEITRATKFVLNNVTLMSLKKCVKIRGYIMITEKSFTRNGVTVPMLYENLNRLEDLEGGFQYYLDTTLKNLTFLSNLKIFRATSLHDNLSGIPSMDKFSIYNTELEFLGLKSLKTVIGSLIFYKNPKLCYMNFPWKEIGIGNFHMTQNNSCPGKHCHTECSHKGCWGPGENMCFDCRHFDANGMCVSNCSTPNGFYFPVNISNANVSNPVCHKCHNECERTCNGPGPRECLNGCLNKKENKTCVPKCSIYSYSPLNNSKLCLPCHSSCLRHSETTCTGPSDILGYGGCNKCSLILLGKNESIIGCVQKCPNRTFRTIKADSSISQNLLSYSVVCLPCHNLCSKCSDGSPKKVSCEVCTGVWYNNVCMETCPQDDSFGIEIINNSKTCKTCHKACAGGCSNSTSADCYRCKDMKIYIQHDSKVKKFYCDKTCPNWKPLKEIETNTNDIVCLSLEESKVRKEELKRTKVTVGVVLAMFFLVIFVIIIIVVCLRRKAISERLEADLKAHYSNLTEPNSKDEDMLSKPPNMGRLVIVSKGDLTFEDQTRPLGFGAFGYVYKGKWKIPKEEDSLLRKSDGDFFLPVAIKVIKNMGNDEIESIMQEAKIMASVSHMHCLRFIGVCLSYEKPCLISAYVKEGSLDKYLVRNKSKITSLIMLSWSEQIADGMLYLTKRNIIHRDLAARNVLVTRLECVQITDFGLAKMLESTKEKEIIIKTGKVPIRWLAIETLTEGRYSYETDVWAYGVTLWEIFTFGKVPYEDQATHDIFDFILKGGRLFQPHICSLDVYIIMVNCWLESPNLRPDFQSLMKTFMDYCKNPGRYLSIEGDPYEIPSPNNIEMTNLNNPYYGKQFNFTSTTAETMLPLLNARDSVDSDIKHMNQDDLDVSFSDKEPLPTRTNNRTSNLLKRFQENKQPQNSINTRINNTPQLVSLASQEEPMFRNQSVTSDDDPRYVADPTDKALKIRQQALKSHLLPETPRFHSNISREDNSPLIHTSHPISHITNQDVDDYLEPIVGNNNSLSKNSGTDAEGYLEPVSNSNKNSFFSQDDYVVPSQPNTPTVKNAPFERNPLKNSSLFKQSKAYLTMDDDNSLRNVHLTNTVDDDEYLEPKSSNHLINHHR